MQEVHVATEHAPTLPRPSKKFWDNAGVAAIITAVFAGFAVMILTAPRIDRGMRLNHRTQRLSFIQEPRTGLCFQIDTHDGVLMRADCDDVLPRLERREDWRGDRIWFAKSLNKGVCYASATRHDRHDADDIPAPVPCRTVERYLDTPSRDGLWLYEKPRSE